MTVFIVFQIISHFPISSQVSVDAICKGHYWLLRPIFLLLGAMENWGLITYREAALLYDPKKTAQPAEQYIVEVIAHELAHMWFGNLVSPKWSVVKDDSFGVPSRNLTYLA